MSVAEAARRGKASEQSISNWKRLFLECGKQGLAENGKPGPNARERQLLEELEEVKAALGEAHVELRVWKKSAERAGIGTTLLLPMRRTLTSFMA